MHREITVVMCPVKLAQRVQQALASGRYRIEPDGLYKQCNVCHDWWPADTEFFAQDKNSHSGMNNYCRACRMDRRRAAKRERRVASS